MPRPFPTTWVDIDAAHWAPLEQVALLARRSPELPSFHPGEFMYMSQLSAPRSLRLHLYKHFDTRRYLNLDDHGHAYEYCGSGSSDDPRSSGFYRPHLALVDGIDDLNLRVFAPMVRPPYLRSFPPEEWPPDPVPTDSLTI